MGTCFGLFIRQRKTLCSNTWELSCFRLAKSRGAVEVTSMVFKMTINCVLFLCSRGVREAVLKLIVEKTVVNIFFQEKMLS